jgi:hypothetical protein
MESESQNPKAATKREETHSEGKASKMGLADWLMEISRETSALMDDGRTSKELMDELYDEETGLPK